MIDSTHNNKETTLNEVMEFLQENMVTKDDAKAFVTKDDAKAFVTKSDLIQELRKFQEEILDGVDEKLFNMKGDLIVLMRGDDHKVVSLIGLLREKSVITQDEAKQLLTMKPFPQLRM